MLFNHKIKFPTVTTRFFIEQCKRLKTSLQHSFLPDADCYLCMNNVLSAQNAAMIICADCHQRLALLNNTCPVCSLPLTGYSQGCCGQCLKNAPPYSRTVSAFYYKPPVSDFITSLKFNHQYQLLPVLCHYLYSAVCNQYKNDQLPSQLIPVPLHPKRLTQRGFNQAQLITKQLSSLSGIKMNSHVVVRKRSTQPQTTLNAMQRQKNLKNAFQVNQPARLSRHVAIIDDVKTTSATVTELARQLLESGCQRVDCWTLAIASQD